MKYLLIIGFIICFVGCSDKDEKKVEPQDITIQEAEEQVQEAEEQVQANPSSEKLKKQLAEAQKLLKEKERQLAEAKQALQKKDSYIIRTGRSHPFGLPFDDPGAGAVIVSLKGHRLPMEIRNGSCLQVKASEFSKLIQIIRIKTPHGKFTVCLNNCVPAHYRFARGYRAFITKYGTGWIDGTRLKPPDMQVGDNKGQFFYKAIVIPHSEGGIYATVAIYRAVKITKETVGFFGFFGGEKECERKLGF